MFDIVEIEKKYKHELEAIEEWNYLRNIYRSIDNKVIKKSKINKINFLKSIFYGFTSWFKRYDYLVFSDSSERKLVDDKMFDITVDYIIDVLGRDKTLLIENPIIRHYAFNYTYTRKIVSRRVFDLLTVVLEKFCKIKHDIDILDAINKEYDLAINHKKCINRFNAQYALYKAWFKMLKLKKIYLNCFYDKQYIVKAAKELNIEVIDIQHGVIGIEHSAYYSILSLDDSYIPHQQYSFGCVEQKNSLNYGGIISSTNIFPVGSFYLEYIYKNFLYDKSLKAITNYYRLAICVSLQWTVEAALIDIVVKLATKLTNILFILIPRKYDKQYEHYNFPKNIILYKGLDCYNLIMHSDYHMTVYSTCAMEALAMGIPNILINIDGYSIKYLSFLTENKYTVILDEYEDIQNYIKTLNKVNKNEVYNINTHMYMQNYKQNIKGILNVK